MSAKYMLISVIENDIMNELFEKQDDAISKMQTEFLNALGYNNADELLEDYDECGDCTGEESLPIIVVKVMDEDSAYINKHKAYCDGHAGRCVWRIIELP